MKNFFLLLLAVATVACTPRVERNGMVLSEREAYRYDRAVAAVERVEALLEKMDATPTQEGILELLTEAKKLEYNYDDTGMGVETMMRCDSLKMRIDDCKRMAVSFTENRVVTVGKIVAVDVTEQLLENNEYYPVYLKKGEKFFCTVEASEPVTVKLYNADTEKLMKSYKGRNVSDSLSISNSAVYLLEIVPQGKTYVSTSLSYRCADAASLNGRPSIRTEQVECNKGNVGAVAVPGIAMRKCFEEPRKFTLRGQIKAAFSGNAQALVAVTVPAGATDILYSMRIATSEQDRSDDGQFHDNLTRSYKRIKFLGLPLYEKSSSNGLLNTLLDDNRPIREEDAYCNMYVFRNKTQAKKFQDGTKTAAGLDYDVDYSTLGTQSCNGRIPVNGAKTIYLAFENERMRYTNYLWVEVEAVLPETVYYTTKYSVR
ncbi:MAG: hypothetical protein IKU76_07150 [Bacteroidaceae bacterium]|nr:hypothetical protein [Bacteroidaceae bacterium]